MYRRYPYGRSRSVCGQGIASQLTVAVLEDLKRQGLKVVPLCRFMARYILRHPEWKQMVADK